MLDLFVDVRDGILPMHTSNALVGYACPLRDVCDTEPSTQKDLNLMPHK